MIPFVASAPFPSIDPANVKQSEVFAHAAACDRWLDLRLEKIETELAQVGCRLRAPRASGEKQQIWIGLEPQMLLTPYTEIRWLLEKLALARQAKVIDLGAAYGRMGFVMARHFPQAEFIGYEYVGERVKEANRALTKFGAVRARVEHADLASNEFQLEQADVFFLYDFGTPKAIEKILYQLRKAALQKPFTLVVRGRHSRYLIDQNHGWLQDAYPLEDEGRVTIYKSSLDREIPAAM
jgi:Methyltransferase domain